jgi:hypothetical protein
MYCCHHLCCMLPILSQVYAHVVSVASCVAKYADLYTKMFVS